MNLRLHITFRLWLLSLLLLLCSGSSLFAQVTATINATGTTGSYNTGSVNSGGTKNDDLMVTINQTTNRGWAVFDLSTIPAGSTVTSVSINFTTTPNTVLSGATNYIGGYQWTSANNPATVTGSTLYTLLDANATTNFSASTWGANTAITLALNTAGATLISNNLGGKVVMSFVRGSTNTYEIYGYGSTSTQQPKLIITYTPNVACTGTPTGGTAVASATAVCPTTAVNLSLSGQTAATGLTYQWESSPAGLNTWTPISGATLSTYSTTITGNTDFHAIITCAATPASATSSPVTVNLNSFYGCYCASAATNTADEEIDTVTFNGVSNTGGCTTAAPGAGSLLNRYSNFTTLGALTSVMQGSTVPFDIKEDECDGSPYYGNGIGIWIDFNHNGSFSDPGEAVYIESATATSPRHAIGNITIPITAMTGTTGMRIIAAEGLSGTGLTPCISYGYGETEDYLINITAAPSCSGTPSAGTITGPATSCPNAPFTLVDNGYTVAAGLNFQWESSPAGANVWTPITGATNTTYIATTGITTATDYHLKVTCTNGGGTATSATFAVGMSPFYICYCGPATGISLNSIVSNYLSNVSITNGTLNNTTTTPGPGSYTLFYPTTATTTDALYQGQQYTINTTHPFTGYYSTAWIDYNGDGTFSASESIALTTTGLNANGTFLVPLAATPGLTGLRVRTYYTALTGAQACAVNNSYETEDYVITILATPPCSGTPVAGTATGPATACSGSNFNLGVSGYTVGTGISLVWESSPAGAGVWTPISGATNPTYTVTGGITTPTDYHVVITCANGGGTDVSNTIAVGISPFYLCYCGPNTGISLSSFYDNYITNVNVTNGALNNTTTAVGANGYSLFYPLTATNTDNFFQGQQYTLNVTHLYTYYYSAAWLDMNGDGVFSSSEYITLTTANAGNSVNANGTFTVPFSAVPGTTGLRVRTWYTSLTAGQACAVNSSYETEDYVVSIVAPPGCSGTPTAGTASAPTSVCTGANFNLGLAGYTVAAAIGLQWESSPAGVNTWTPISGATNPTYTVSGGITTATDYRAVVTCANGGAQDISNVVSITINPFYACYCASGATTPYDEEIVNVTVGTMNNSSTCATTGGTGSVQSQYSNYSSTVTPTQVSQGQTVTFSIGVGTCGGNYPSGTAIFVDYNQNGSFADPGEMVYGTTGTTTGPHIVTGTFTVPLTATVGITGMRVINAEGYNGTTITPCLNTYGYGETEDYSIDIAQAVGCIGAPTAGTLTGPANACAAVAFTMNLAGYSVASGITFQWESSPAGLNTWTQISGATLPTYTQANQTVATDYRVVVTCNGTASTNSNTLSVAQNPATQCYCIPGTTNPNASDHIMNVTFAGINNTTGGSGTNGYNDYFNTITPASVAQSGSYPISMTIANGGTEYGGIWIDWDQNGVFDASEFTYMGTGATPTVLTQTLLVPATAVLGTTRMRVRSKYGSIITTADPCSAYTYGETEDYAVTVTAAAACVAPTGLGVTNVGAGTADIGWTAVSGATGYEYAITTSSTPPSSGTATSAASVTGATFTSGSQSYWLHVRTNCGGSGYSSWTTFAFISNDNATGAMLLTVGGGCTGNPYTNANATQSAGEVYPSCNNAGTGVKTVWFKFVAPTSGTVRISTDNSPQGTLTDSKVGLFSATSASNYATFNIISCDEDGGVVGSGFNSILYATGLTSGTTYYVEVDVYDASTPGGTFCITVDEMNSSMIASGAASCATAQTPELNTTTYTGWTPLLTSTGQLIALVRNSGGAAGIGFSANLTVNTAAVRQAGNQYYLDRNYKINNANITTATDVQLFFLNSELTALSTATGGGGVTLSQLNVTKQTGTTCQANYAVANGTNSALLQSANGTIGGASWIQVSTSSFSNFYIMSGAFPLSIKLRDISATNVGARNRVDWNTESELKSDKFEVERSVDGRNFTYLATINAKGAASAYSYWDEKPVTGVNYYRLKMTDASGKSAYSEIVHATVKEGAFTVEAYPNPVSDVLTVKAYGTSSANATVTIMDATGKVVKIVTVVNGMAQVNMSGLAQGIYQVKYADNNHIQTIKVNKQ